MNTAAAVGRHYGSAGIAERVLAAWRAANGNDAPVTPEGLAPFDHFHGRGVAATQEIAAQLALRPGERVLDIGSGIGGAGPRVVAPKNTAGGRGAPGPPSCRSPRRRRAPPPAAPAG